MFVLLVSVHLPSLILLPLPLLQPSLLLLPQLPVFLFRAVMDGLCENGPLGTDRNKTPHPYYTGAPD